MINDDDDNGVDCIIDDDDDDNDVDCSIDDDDIIVDAQIASSYYHQLISTIFIVM